MCACAFWLDFNFEFFLSKFTLPLLMYEYVSSLRFLCPCLHLPFWSNEKNDQLFIFFAGHGQFDEIFTEGYLVGSDSKLSDPGKTSYISHSTLRTVVN